MRLGAYIRNSRIEKELTLNYVSKAAGISATFLGDIERGLRPCPKERIPAIAEALGENPTRLERLRIKTRLAVVKERTERRTA